MDSIAALIRRAERDAAVIPVVREARTTLELLQIAGVGIDLRPDIEKLTEVLILLAYPGCLTLCIGELSVSSVSVFT